jgi:hypothetical protein
MPTKLKRGTRAVQPIVEDDPTLRYAFIGGVVVVFIALILFVFITK